MGNVSVPPSVQKHLSEGEQVLGKLAGRGADYYATSKRLLRFTSESQYRSLEYADMSVDLVKHGPRVAIGRWVSLVVGLLIIGFGLLFLSVADEASSPGFPGGSYGVAGFICLIGFGLAFLGASLRTTYYQIRSRGIAESDKEWQVGDPFRWSHSADDFVEILKQRSVSR